MRRQKSFCANADLKLGPGFASDEAVDEAVGSAFPFVGYSSHEYALCISLC